MDPTRPAADRVAAIAVLLCVAGAQACALPLDVLGADETVIETASAAQRLQAPPEFDPELTIRERFDGCEFTLNKSAALTALTIAEPEDARLKTQIFPTRQAALAALGTRPVIPSIEVVNGALKPFNDGLYAAIELVVEDGAEASSVDKRATLNALLATLLDRSQAGDQDATTAAVDFAAAASYFDPAPEVGQAIQTRAAVARAQFEADVFRSTPIGFYTWSPELARIFQRDRFLQGASPGFGPVAALARSLRTDADLARRYRALLDLYRGLTNPWRDFDPLSVLDSPASLAAADLSAAESQFVQAHPSLAAAPPCQGSFSWLPASDSPEQKLIASRYCAGRPVPNLLDALIAAIQSGEIDLTPTSTSGFYDWQLHALEALLLPERSSEGKHLRLTQKYKDKLIETFKSLLIQTRETHVKQLGTFSLPTSAPYVRREVDIYPLLPLEPFPTFYLRSARAYEFLHGVLLATLGEPALDRTARLFENGERAPLSIARELTQKAELLYGLHLVAAASIGMRDELSADERARFDPAGAERAARAFIDGWRDDRDVRADPRVAVPLVQDAEHKLTRNLAVVGIKAIRISARFGKGFEPRVIPDSSPTACTVRDFVPWQPYMLIEQTLEFARNSAKPPLTRDALRAIIGTHDSLEQIRTALEAP